MNYEEKITTIKNNNKKIEELMYKNKKLVICNFCTGACDTCIYIYSIWFKGDKNEK